MCRDEDSFIEKTSLCTFFLTISGKFFIAQKGINVPWTRARAKMQIAAVGGAQHRNMAKCRIKILPA